MTPNDPPSYLENMTHTFPSQVFEIFMNIIVSVHFIFFEKNGQKCFIVNRPLRLTMSFSGLALTYTFVQDSTKNVISIFQFFLNLFIFGEKVNSRKKGKLIFFKVNHMLMWKTKN